MKLGGLGPAGRELRNLIEGGSTAALSDGQLLARFSSGQGDASSEAAFAALVARHGPMVWGTCRRILRDPHAAEDAFQATFLILVRKAGSVRVEDSLGRWLHGVVVRVALRAKSVEARSRGGVPPGLEPSTLPIEPDLDDLRAAIDEEVDRLPSPYRSVVVLCHLEGLTRERAASRLGCPIGTVNSRLSRASGMLKARLARRGLAPASGALAAWLAASEGTARASITVPPSLIQATAVSAAGVASGGATAGLVPAGAWALGRATLRSMTMMAWLKTVSLWATLLALTAFATVAGSAAWQEGRKEPRAQGDFPKPEAVAEASRPQTPSEQFRAILAEWQAAIKARQDAVVAAKAQGKSQAERDEIARKLAPDLQAFFRRCLELAERDPKDPGSRDALVWVATRGAPFLDGNVGDPTSPVATQARAAVDRLLRHHPGDPSAVRVVLNLGNSVNQEYDALVRSVFDRAEGRESKGIATLAMAQYLDKKATAVAFAIGNPVQPTSKVVSYDEQGRPRVADSTRKPFTDAYYDYLKTCDAPAIRRESDELYRRLIKDYADVPYEAPGPRPNPEKARPAKTLGEVAEAHYALAFGQPAPEIEGPDLDGRPLKLSSSRGKVVVVAFWSSPHAPKVIALTSTPEMVARLEDRRVVFLGVNCDETPEAARKSIRDAGITWPNWLDGSAGRGPIFNRYFIKALPTFLVVDAKGAIRSKSLTSMGVGKLLDTLLAEIEPAK